MKIKCKKERNYFLLSGDKTPVPSAIPNIKKSIFVCARPLFCCFDVKMRLSFGVVLFLINKPSVNHSLNKLLISSIFEK